MIGKRPSGITLRASFDEFIVVPDAAWRQCKAAIVKMMELYGFHGTVLDVGGQTEAYERWTRQMEAEFKRDIDAQDGITVACKCRNRSQGYCDSCQMRADTLKEAREAAGE